MSMSRNTQSGYLFDRNIRRLPVISWISGIGIYAFSLLLWHLFFADGLPLMLTFAIAFTAFTVHYTFGAIKSGAFTGSTYTCRDNMLTVTSGKQQYTFDLDKPFWLTKCTIRLYVGKGGYYDIPLIAVTPERLSSILPEFKGQAAFTKVFISGGILLPEETENWVLSKTGAQSISEHPKSMYFPGREVTR